MNLGDCTVTIGDQTFRATNVRIDHNGSYATASVEAAMLEPIEKKIDTHEAYWKAHYDANWTFNEDAKLTSIQTARSHGKSILAHHIVGEGGSTGYFNASSSTTTMGEKSNREVIKTEYDKDIKDMCREEASCADEYISGNELARKMVNLELTDEQRLLRRHNIVNLDGTLTPKGKDFLLNVLFEQAEDEVIDALTAIEIAEAEERE
jgi:hypothetical protein